MTYGIIYALLQLRYAGARARARVDDQRTTIAVFYNTNKVSPIFSSSTRRNWNIDCFELSIKIIFFFL